jgi:predicted DNA binding protein
VKEVLASAGREWNKLFNQSFAQIEGEARIEKAFVISESNFEEIIKEFLLIQGSEEGAINLTDKEVVLIQSAFFKNFIDMAGSSDAFIASEAYYADKLLKRV